MCHFSRRAETAANEAIGGRDFCVVEAWCFLLFYQYAMIFFV